MSHLLNTSLPPELEEYRNQIEASVKPFIKITAEPNSNLSLWQSKFGGLPYLPKDFQYPRGSNNRPLFLLAQINFAELPILEPFPEKGLLQFYIADDDLYGLEFHDMTKQGKFQILYFSEIVEDSKELITDFDFLPTFELVPLRMSYSLTFELDQQPISAGDYQFEDKIFNSNKPEPEEKYGEIVDQYEKLFTAIGHRIGGYPFFTQSDPRSNKRYIDSELQLLLQIDTDENTDIMWGDAGVGNFFIRESDLKNCDFSHVMYNWDCA